MPKSKRDRLVTLSKVKKKTKEWKEGLITTVRKHIDEYPNIYVLKYQNLRNDKFKELREDLRESSRFCFGSTKVMKVALGTTASEEYQNGLAEIAGLMRGHVGLLFTKLDREEVLRIFESWEAVDYARAGSKATEEFSLEAGPLENPDGPLSHTIEPLLRKHNLPVKLNRGVVELLDDHKVCAKGQTLNPDQAAILRVFQKRTSTFRFIPLAHWAKEDGHVDMLETEESFEEEEEEMEEDLSGFGGVAVPGIPAGVKLSD